MNKLTCLALVMLISMVSCMNTEREDRMMERRGNQRLNTQTEGKLPINPSSPKKVTPKPPKQTPVPVLTKKPIARTNRRLQPVVAPVIEQPVQTVPQTRRVARLPVRDETLTGLCLNRNSGDHIADPTNVKGFLVCGKDSDFQLMRCPGNLVFNEGLQRCDHHAVNVVSPCVSNPCHNGGKCSAIDQFTFTCECLEGFRGEHCDNRLVTRASICASNPCGENNECTPLSALSTVPFICTCNHGEGYGINCDANMFQSPCTRESAEQYHVSQLGSNSFIHCEFGNLHVKFCNEPLLWNMDTHSCVFPEDHF